MPDAQPLNIVEHARATTEFVLLECARFLEITKNKQVNEWLREIAPADLRSQLHLSNGRALICGKEASQRLYHLATVALKSSDVAGAVEAERVYDALKRLIPLWFIEEQRPQDAAQVELVLGTALAEAKQARINRTHFLPCRLMFTKKPLAFQIGPVRFRTAASFHEVMETRYATYAASDDAPERRPTCEHLLASARSYYDSFSWVGEVRIVNCDPATSKKRALLAVTAALDFIHLVFGAYHTSQMTVGGPSMPDDRRAHIHMDDDGTIDVSCSSAPTSALGFRDGWEEILGRPDFAAFLQIADKLLAPVVDPSIRNPLALRSADAAAWFGDAAREPSPAARIVKASNALEHAVATGEERGFTRQLVTAVRQPQKRCSPTAMTRLESW